MEDRRRGGLEAHDEAPHEPPHGHGHGQDEELPGAVGTQQAGPGEEEEDGHRHGEPDEPPEGDPRDLDVPQVLRVHRQASRASSRWAIGAQVRRWCGVGPCARIAARWYPVAYPLLWAQP